MSTENVYIRSMKASLHSFPSRHEGVGSEGAIRYLAIPQGTVSATTNKRISILYKSDGSDT